MRNELVDAGFNGEAYTWSNNRRGQARILERLDRVLFNVDFQTDFSATSVHHLTRIYSDHSPLLVQLEGEVPRISSRFIFQRMWVDHPDFLHIVAADWAKPMMGSPGLIFWRKLMRLKHTLKSWNWSIFGNIYQKKRDLQGRIQSLEIDLQQGWSNTVHTEWDNCRAQLS